MFKMRLAIIDDRQVESSHSTESQELSHQDSTPQHEENIIIRMLKWINQASRN